MDRELMLGQLSELTQEHLVHLQNTFLENERQKQLETEHQAARALQEKLKTEARALAQTTDEANATARRKKHHALLEALESIRNSSHPYQQRYQPGKATAHSSIIRAKKP